MTTEDVTLRELRLGESMTVRSVGGESAMKRRLEDLGMIEGTKVSCLLASPWGELRAYELRGAVIALRNCDAQAVRGYRTVDSDRDRRRS